MPKLLIGIDVGNYEHQICVLDEERQVVAEFAVTANGEGEGRLLSRLRSLCEGDLSQTLAGAEVTAGAIVEALLDAGVSVYGINPKQIDRFRERISVAGAKSDRRDARVIASALATDLVCFRRLSLATPEIVELRGLAREAEELKEDRRRACNRLRSELLRYYPQILELSPGVDEGWIWDLLELAPTPAEARRKTLGKIRGLLRENRIRRVTAEEVRGLLKSKAVSAAPGVTKAASKHALRLLKRVRLLDSQLRVVEGQMDEILNPSEEPGEEEANQQKQRDAKTLQSLPGAGRAVVATLLTEATEALESRDYQALRAQAGVAPVTRSSGKRTTVSFRRACNRRLRNAVHHFARVAIQNDLAARSHYDRLRAKGHSFPRALRSVADRLLRIAVAMLRDGTLYDPTRVGATRAASARSAVQDESPLLALSAAPC